jgi:hypothetical protein
MLQRFTKGFRNLALSFAPIYRESPNSLEGYLIIFIRDLALSCFAEMEGQRRVGKCRAAVVAVLGTGKDEDAGEGVAARLIFSGLRTLGGR